MRTRTATALKLALVLLLLCAVGVAQAASVSSEPLHHHSSTHCCGLCHAGMPFVQPSANTTVVPVLAGAWLETTYCFQSIHDAWRATGSSRAPPA